MLTLAWKEYREHRSIWLTMAFMTGVLGLGLAQFTSPQDSDASRLGLSALIILGMAATYGVVCGGMMLAGEWEAGTMVFLDIFSGRRGLLWFGKFVIGVLLALSEALAVALVLLYVNQAPPDWLPILIGHGSRSPATLGNFAPVPPGPGLWFLVLPVVTVEAYAWGLLGSALSRRVLAGAGLAALIATPLWLITIFMPPPVFLSVRLVAVVVVLIISSGVFLAQAREPTLGLPPKPEELEDPRKRRFREWEDRVESHRQRRAPRLDHSGEPVLDVSVLDVSVPAPEERSERGQVVRRRRRVPQAGSPQYALWWLTLRQSGLLLGILAGVCFVLGFFVPSGGQVLWPVATLLLGVACGTAAFAQEQRDLSYQFLAAQHFPLKTFWNIKILFWFTAAVLLALVLFGSGGLVVLIKSVSRQRPRAIGFDDNGPIFPDAPPTSSTGFEFGTLLELMGPVLFFGVWLVYGFCIGQGFVLLCRKNVLAVLLAGLTSAGVIGLWLTSLLCRGMSGWQLWLPPLLLLVATRLLVRAWAGGRIKERKPLAALIGFSLAALVWIGLNFGYRAWEIPDVGEPLDRQAFRASVPAGENNRGGEKILQALGEMDKRDWREGLWLPPIAEAVRLPVGVLETPPANGPPPLLSYLPGCRKIANVLRILADEALAEGKPGRAFEHLAQILALSRTLRNKAPLASYLAGVEIEEQALQGLDLWLAHGKPSPGQLRRVLDMLNRHAAETPPPRECVQAECLRTGGVVETPAAWSFYAAHGGSGRGSEGWLAGGIAFSLDTPWEKERSIRLWQAVWAGLFRAVETPYWQLPETAAELESGKGTTPPILLGWLPAAEGPGSSLTSARLAKLLNASWLSDERLFSPVVRLRAAATRARWRLDSRRLEAALGLYQLREGKAAPTLDALVPNYLPKLPVDPYSGQAFRYRISKGEEIEVLPDVDFQGRMGAGRGTVRPGQGVLWSTGPDRADQGGRKHGGPLAEDDARWAGEGFDLVTVVPFWP
jgi:hypothetical protein